MTTWLPYLFLAGCIAVIGTILSHRRAAVRAEFVRHYTLPYGIFDKLRVEHPSLTTRDCQLITQALQQFFLAYLKGGFQSVSMPSQITDDLWHEFILYTKAYHHFCIKAFGRFLHHTPAAVLGSVAAQDQGLRRCWRLVCREEGINPRQPTRVPLLFAIDGQLNIPGGFRYVADCNRLGRADTDGRPVHCGGDFGLGCSSGDWSLFQGFGMSSFLGDGGFVGDRRFLEDRNYFGDRSYLEDSRCSEDGGVSGDSGGSGDSSCSEDGGCSGGCSGGD